MSLQLFTQYDIYPSGQQRTFTEATGGQWTYEIMENGAPYRVHEFTQGMNDFEVTKEGDFEYTIAGSGEGGVAGSAGYDGKGVQVLSGVITLTLGTYPITVGTDGQAGQDSGNDKGGNDTTAFGLTATRGAVGTQEVGDGSNGANGTLSFITGEPLRYGPDCVTNLAINSERSVRVELLNTITNTPVEGFVD